MPFKPGDKIIAKTAHLTDATDRDSWRRIPDGTHGTIYGLSPAYPGNGIQAYNCNFKNHPVWVLPESCLELENPFYTRIAHKAKTQELFL